MVLSRIFCNMTLFAQASWWLTRSVPNCPFALSQADWLGFETPAPYSTRVGLIVSYFSYCFRTMTRVAPMVAVTLNPVSSRQVE